MRKFLKGLFWIALVIGVVIGLLRGFALRWVRVPADDPLFAASVSPTMAGGDLVVLWRATEPKYGDLVVCPNPQDDTEAVIGRIAAEEGDEIRIEGHTLHVNNSRVRNETACNPRKFKTEHPHSGSKFEQYCDMEVLGGRLHKRGNTANQNWPALNARAVVGEGKIYLVSDNRLFHWDSRDFGTVDRASCTESVVFRLVGKAGFSDHESRFTSIH